jgi:hypothetical protein
MGPDELDKFGRRYSDVGVGHRGDCEDRQQKKAERHARLALKYLQQSDDEQ